EAATETFANVIVCVARDIERNALHEPRAETLPARAAQLHRELPFRQRILADAARDVRRRARTDGALRVANIEDELLLLATLEKAWRLIDEFVVKRLRRFVAAKQGAIAWVRAIDAYEQRIEIEIVEVLGAAADLFDQIRAADDVFEAPEADHGEDFAHFLGDEAHQIHDFIRRTRELLAKRLVLGADADGACV